MGRPPVPLAHLARRIPEAGRIRIGVKASTGCGKERPKALDRFRFTSHDQEALGQIAAMYGGAVVPWSDPKAAPGQFEVVTDAPEVRVVLPPDPLGGTPVYEHWSGGGCDRRCDGATCASPRQGPDGVEYAEVPCMCLAAGAMTCDVVTRLSVILPEVRFAGVWRLDTKSWNAAQELPGMVDMIQTMQGQGLAYATLSLRRRQSVIAGRTQQFVTPVLGIPASIEQLAAGGSRLSSLTAGNHVPEVAGALEPGPRDEDRDPPDDVELEAMDRHAWEADQRDRHDNVVDAEVVDTTATEVAGTWPGPGEPWPLDQLRAWAGRIVTDAGHPDDQATRCWAEVVGATDSDRVFTARQAERVQADVFQWVELYASTPGT